MNTDSAAEFGNKVQSCGTEDAKVLYCYRLYYYYLFIYYATDAFSALTLLVGRQEGHPACKNRVVGTGVVICLARGADLHMPR